MKVGGGHRSDRYHIQAEINMIPLIDVALVLLIIFMVISPILVESQLSVKLPQVSTAVATQETALKVSISDEGKIEFQGELVAKEGFRNVLAKAFPLGSKGSLLIQADKDVKFDDVVFVMDIAKQLNVEHLGVAVLPKNGN